MAAGWVDNRFGDGIFVHHVHGDPSPQLLADAVAWRSHHPNFSNPVRILWDLAAADLGTTAVDRMVGIFRAVREELPVTTGRIAIVAPAGINYGRARQYQGVTEQDHPYEVAVFDTLEPALAWLYGTGDNT